jgi:hypothetical protein
MAIDRLGDDGEAAADQRLRRRRGGPQGDVASRLERLNSWLETATSRSISGKSRRKAARIGEKKPISSVSVVVTRRRPEGLRSRPASWRSTCSTSASTRRALMAAASPAAVGR